ncbi:MAG: radical SAM protein [Nitrospinae bacterium]|nr:radical SAM protein [Nitrospinota bacterium]
MAMIKQLLNLAKFKLGGVRPVCGPMKVQWELTYHCNLKCQHCQIWKIPHEEVRKNTLPLDKQKKILDDLAASGVRHVSFSGGEMFLQKTVYELIAHAKSLGMKVGGNSNAFLINGKIARKIADCGLDMLYISMDGDNAATHDEIRGVKGAFDRVFQAVRNLRAAKPGIRLFFNTTINAKNVGQLNGVAKLAREAGINGLTIEMTNTFDKYSPNRDLILPQDLLPTLKEQLDGLFRDYPDMLPHPRGYFDEFETYLNRPDELYKYRCVAGYTTAQIHPNGDLYPCPVAFKKLGNLSEKSFNEIWFSPRTDQVRREIKEGNHPICWVTCVSPLNQYLSYLAPRLDFFRLLSPNTISHILKKI